eukprot:6212629-Pleurochrysis_carterae.AAC.3
MRELVKNTAVGKGAAASSSSVESVQQVKKVELLDVKKRQGELKEPEVQLPGEAELYDKPLSYRLVYFPLEKHEEGKELRDTGIHSPESVEILKQGDIAALLSQGKAKELAVFSPMKNRTRLAVELVDLDDDDDEPPAPDPPNDHEQSDKSDGERECRDSDVDEDGLLIEKPAGAKGKQVERRSKRVQVAAMKAREIAAFKTPTNDGADSRTVNLDSVQPTSIRLDGTDTSSGESAQAKRSYRKTDMYSKDPAMAARAIAGHLKGKAEPCAKSTTARTASKAVVLNIDTSELAKVKQQLVEVKADLKFKEHPYLKFIGSWRSPTQHLRSTCRSAASRKMRKSAAFSAPCPTSRT